jgi:hypothetical protein
MSNECGCQCGETPRACVTEFQYAVKVACGEVKPGNNTPVAPGRYWTAVNVHNPDKCKDANFRLKVGIAQLNLQSPVSQYYGPFALRPDGMVEFDCLVIRFIAGQIVSPAPAFVKGFMVIECDRALDVVAVYSGSAGSTTANSFSTERVPACCVPVCEDLVLPLHTGLADWRTVAPATNAPVVQIPTAGWGAPPLGSNWVSQFGPDTVLTPRRYQLKFDLCSGFTNPSPACQLYVQVNDTATVFLNGTQVAPTVPLLGTPTLVTLPGPASYRAGPNQLEVVVTNTAGQTGFAVTGIIHVPRGKCPCARLPVVMARPGTTGTTGTTGAAETTTTSATLFEQITAASKSA